MALVKCPDCGRAVSDQAPTCVGCGRPNSQARPPTLAPAVIGTKCPKCQRVVLPIVTNVGGGSCSFGSREKWSCPACKGVIQRTGCFVATSTYGDEDAVEVRFLRAFRDEKMRNTPIGRLFINVYYAVGPYAARVVETAPGLKAIARRLLDGIVLIIEKRTLLRREHYR